jgi:hypothetical protein
MTRKPWSGWRACFALGAMAAVLAACGGGNGSDGSAGSSGSSAGSSNGSSNQPGNQPSANPAQGAYAGTLTGSLAPNFDLLVLANGDTWSIYGNSTNTGFSISSFMHGTANASNGSFSISNLKDYATNPATPASATATYSSSPLSINGTVKENGATIAFNGGALSTTGYNYDQTASLASIAHSWTVKSMNTGETINLTISSIGAITGSSSLGCTFTGTAAPDASGKNVFDMTLNLGATCLPANTAFTGIIVAYPIAGSTMTQLFYAAYDNATQNIGLVGYGAQ